MEEDRSMTTCIEMGLTEVRSEEPLLQSVQRSRTSCFHWLSICSFVLLLGTTIFLALLHFQIIQTEKKVEYQIPEVLQIKTYLESAPQTQAMKGKRAAAHLLGKKLGSTINWQSMSENAFKDGSIQLVDNSLKIEVTGLYLVYTQVVFTGTDCPEDDEFSHSVTRKTNLDEDTIDMLKSTKTMCEANSSSSWTQPIYQGGLFQLLKGDILKTETSKVEYLDTNHGQVYFGILAV